MPGNNSGTLSSHVGTAQGHTVRNRVLQPHRSPPAPSRCSHLGEGGVLPLRQQASEQGGAVEAHDRGEH